MTDLYKHKAGEIKPYGAIVPFEEFSDLERKAEELVAKEKQFRQSGPEVLEARILPRGPELPKIQVHRQAYQTNQNNYYQTNYYQTNYYQTNYQTNNRPVVPANVGHIEQKWFHVDPGFQALIGLIVFVPVACGLIALGANILHSVLGSNSPARPVQVRSY